MDSEVFHRTITPRGWGIIFGAIIVSFIASIVAAIIVTNHVEKRGREIALAALAVEDFAQISIVPDGMRLHLQGEVADENDSIRVQNTVGKVINPSRIFNELEISKNGIQTSASVALEIVKNRALASMIGLIPETEGADDIINQINRLRATHETLVLVTPIDGEIEEGWSESIEFSKRALSIFDQIKLSIQPGIVDVQTIAESAEDIPKMEREIQALAPTGLKLNIRVDAPRPLITPFVFSAKKEDGKLEITQCSVSSNAELFEVSRRVKAMGGGDIICQSGIGSPTDNWADVIDSVLTEMQAIPYIEASIIDSEVNLTVDQDTEETTLNTLASRIRRGLPPGFSLETNRITVLKTIDELAEEGQDSVLEITRSRDGNLDLYGVVSNLSAQDSLTSIATAKFGSDNIQISAIPADGLPIDWDRRALAALEGLSKLEEGRVVIGLTQVSLEGVASSNAIKDEVLNALKTSENDIPIVDAIDVVKQQVSEDDAASNYLEETVNDQTLEAAEPEVVDAQECNTSLRVTLENQPVSFKPGSSELTDESIVTIAQLVDILAQCNMHQFEIAGYTDSQGSEEGNLKLSQTRADAVLEALQSQGINLGALEAKGYGEADPIASNDTEQGRAKNRRIEIKIQE